jgi:outer membrane receptor protein involved in Fe transport
VLTLSPNSVNQLQLRIENFRVGTEGNSQSPKLIVEGAFVGGGVQDTHGNNQSSVALNDSFSWTSRRHQVKVGINLPALSANSVVDRSNFGGTFYFSNIAAYLAGQPYLLRWQKGDPRVRFGYQEIAGFAQDQIRLTPRLFVTLGLRYDWQSYFSAGKDFAPRISLAFALDKKSKNLVRAGAGIFYDRSGVLPIADLLRYNASHLRDYSLTNPVLANGVPTDGTTGIPSNIVILAHDARVPYSAQYSLGIEHRLSRQTSIALTYRGARGLHLFRSVDINAPPPPEYLLRPDPHFGIVRQIQSEARQISEGLDISFTGSITKYFTGQAQYNLGWTKNDTGGITYFPSNNYDPTGEWARGDRDQRHRLHLLGTIYVRNWFTVGLILSAGSGKPYTVTSGRDNYNDDMDNSRPLGVPRNSRQGSGYISLDLRLSHDFLVKPKDKKGRALTAAVEAFNVSNHVNYNTYVGVLTSPLFAQPVSAYPPRRLQMSLGFRF